MHFTFQRLFIVGKPRDQPVRIQILRVRQRSIAADELLDAVRDGLIEYFQQFSQSRGAQHPPGDGFAM